MSVLSIHAFNYYKEEKIDLSCALVSTQLLQTCLFPVVR
jgi:hypothetical protein